LHRFTCVELNDFLLTLNKMTNQQKKWLTVFRKPFLFG